MPFLEECDIYGGMCHFCRNVTFLEECAIFGRMYHFWRNVTFLEECALLEEFVIYAKLKLVANDSTNAEFLR